LSTVAPLPIAAFVHIAAVQTPLRQSVARSHVPPVALPQIPSVGQMALTQAALVEQVAPFGAAQVFADALHNPEAHTPCAIAAPHTPACAPSFGIGAPGASFSVQVSVSAAQNESVAQSASSRQLPVFVGLHTPSFTLQTPLWQRAGAVVASHGPLPSTCPHIPLAPHAPIVHCDAEVHVEPFAPEQVLVTALHWPLAHTVAPLPGRQPSSCKPSRGMATPLPRRATQLKVAGAQNVAPVQSASTAQRPAPVGTHRLPVALQRPLRQRAAVAVEQPASPSARAHSPSLPHAFIAHSPST
jgi:hypothetical protein